MTKSRFFLTSLLFVLCLISAIAATESPARLEIRALNRNSSRANVVILENNRTEYRIFYPKVGSSILSDLNLYMSIEAESLCGIWMHSSFGMRLYFEGKELVPASFLGSVMAPKPADLIVLNPGENLFEKINAVVKRDKQGKLELVYYEPSGACYRFGSLSQGRYELEIFYDKCNSDANIIGKLERRPWLLSYLNSPRFALWLSED